MARTIQSPGVEINEIDLSLRPVIPVGTDVLVSGFATQGPIDDVLEITSLSEFEVVYGKPTNAAERYFYHTAKSVFGSDARVLATRLPYGSAAGLNYGDSYTALFFPVLAVDANQTTFASNASASTGVSLSAATGGYILGKPSLIELDQAEYLNLQRGNFAWKNWVNCNPTFSNATSTWGKAGVIVTNKAKSTINDKYEGYYLNLADNSQLNPATDFDSVLTHYSVSENNKAGDLEVPATRRNFPLSGTETSNDGSISETIENIPTFDISGDAFKDTIIASVFKMRSTIFTADSVQLDYVLAEGHVGSLDSYRSVQDQNGGSPKSFFLGNVEDSSPNVEVFVNPYISTKTGSWLDSSSNNPSKFVRVLTTRAKTDATNFNLSANFGVRDEVLSEIGTSAAFDDSTKFEEADALLPLGVYQKADPQTKIIGAVPSKLSRIFSTIENVDLVNIDLTVEGGLGTVYAGSEDAQSNDGFEVFDDERVIDIGTSSGTETATGLYKPRVGLDSDHNGYTIQQNWKAVHDEFHKFAEFKRKDHLHIADPIKHIFVQGRNDKVLNDKTRTFTQSVYWPLRHQFGAVNTSFCTTYGNWARMYDGTADKHFWAPFSGVAAATMANTDSTYAQWWAPAGFTRGRFAGVSDLAVTPTQKHRDQLYKIAINPVHQFPNEGMVIWGQKTLFKNPSAFDRINVRRLFLFLEKTVRMSMRFYVFEPNTLLTRTQVINNLTPIFDNVRNTQGLYDYLLICDERNNTPDRIDQNELIIDIYIKPVRAAEFILVNFYATRTGQDFSELLY